MEFKDIKEINGAFTVSVISHHDNRGVFQEHYNMNKYHERVSECKQISFSKSKKNVMRGIHCSGYGKLIQCIHGSIIDTIIDLREESSTYLRHFQVELTGDNNTQLYVPAGCGHGFVSFDDNSMVLYAQEGCYDAQKELNVNFFDPVLGINWVTLSECECIISDADSNSPMLIDARREWINRNAS